MKRLFVICLALMLCCTSFAETMGEKNALRSAKQFLEFMAFSYSGLVEQLEYSGYSHDEATYAADNCGADWKENAVSTAKQYLDFMAFSYSGLVEQLEYGGYTHDEAIYAADVCFNQEPVEEKNYADTSENAQDEEAKQLEAPESTPAEKKEPAIPISEIDLSGLSFDELIALKSQINLALWASDEWQEVTVPQGVWQIGRDIPAGHWSIRMADSDTWAVWAGLTYCDELDESGQDHSPKCAKYLYRQLGKPGSKYAAPEELDIELKEDMYLIIENSDVVFTPFTGKADLGFK